MAMRRIVRPAALLVRRRGLSTLPPRNQKSQKLQRPALQLVSGACGLPHPQKRATGGEDAWFVQGDTVGVADGVGGWARKVGLMLGLDMGFYNRES